jgi:citrate lyase subunit beta/citryl-CoA lyase
MRSLLFVPADRPDRFDKACASGAAAVIVDLEDAVASDRKDSARATLAAWLSPQRRVIVRINAPGTPWYADDLSLVSAPGVLGVVVSKAERVEDLEDVASAARGEVLPLIESAKGLQQAEAIARVHGVARLVFGSIDFQLDLGIQGHGDELLYFRSQLVFVSRLAGLPPPIDGVTVSTGDLDLVRVEAMRARSLGFAGKLCIHPAQVDVVNRAFAPSTEEVSWARRVVALAQESGGSAARLDGQMIDRPLILKAERIIRDVAV